MAPSFSVLYATLLTTYRQKVPQIWGAVISYPLYLVYATIFCETSICTYYIRCRLRRNFAVFSGFDVKFKKSELDGDIIKCDKGPHKGQAPWGLVAGLEISEFDGMTLGTRLFTFMRGELVGTDSAGNKYYKDKRAVAGQREKRWVMYNGSAEASAVPADWHGWLHHRTDETGTERESRKSGWQKDHLPNLTGTNAAYRPPGHILKGSRRDKATGDYEAWHP